MGVGIRLRIRARVAVLLLEIGHRLLYYYYCTSARVVDELGILVPVVWSPCNLVVLAFKTFFYFLNIARA